MKKAFKKLYEKREPIGFILISILLFLCCISSHFVLPTVAVIVLFAAISKDENEVFAILLYIYSFKMIFRRNSENNVEFFSLKCLLFGIIIIKYVFALWKNKRNFNENLFRAICLFLIYVLLPVHTFGIKEFVNYSLIIGGAYVLWMNKKEINAVKVIKSFYLGIIISSIFSLISTNRLNEILQNSTVYGVFRFAALTDCTITLALECSSAILVTLILLYVNKITKLEGCFFVLVLFIIGYNTITRSFVLSVFVGFLIFSILYLVKYKKNSLIKLEIIFTLLLLVPLFFLNPTKAYIYRVRGVSDIKKFEGQEIVVREDVFNANDQQKISEQEYEKASSYEDWYESLLGGKFRYDPGQFGLWKEYLIDWSSSIETILFGRGIGQVEIGQMPAHNGIIQNLWWHGIIGVIFFLNILLCAIKKKFFRLKNLIYLIIFVAGYGIICMFEPASIEFPPFFLLIICCQFCLEKTNFESIEKYHFFEKHRRIL